MAMVDSVGIMHPAYFVGRAEILDWLNSTLQLRLTKIEETASGAVACQVFDLLFPNTVQMSKVNWGARADWEFIGNYKILQSACDKVGVDRKIEVDRLIKAKAQDNLEFMQWLKKFYDDNIGTGNAAHNYDPQGRRALGKGVSVMKWAKTASPGAATGSSAISPQKPNPARPVRTSPAGGSSKVGSTSTASSTTTGKISTQTTDDVRHAQVSNKEKENTEQTALVGSLRLEIDTNRRTLQRVQEETSDRIARLELLLKTCESERDYYLGKLKSVELALQELQGTADGGMVLNTITNVLYDDAGTGAAASDTSALVSGDDQQ